MLLHNQTKNNLRWNISATTYTCEPWGSVEVPDMFVKHCEARGLPLGSVPVPVEIRANTTMADANDKARADELIRLRHEVESAKVSEDAAKAELAKVTEALSVERSKSFAIGVELKEQKRACAEAVSEKNAAAVLIDEAAKKLTETEFKLQRAETALTELKKQFDSASKKQK